MPLRRPQPTPTQSPPPNLAFAVGCLALLHDGRDHIALVRADGPVSGWTLPGASPQGGEDPLQAVSRAASELTDAQVRVGELLVVEWVRADAVHGAPGGLNCIWDIASSDIGHWAGSGGARLGPRDRRLVQIADLAGLGQPLLERRARAAVSARTARRTEYLPPAY
jgi:ADP-ribose pyrophosphatase YjhB (NUDIX family)